MRVRCCSSRWVWQSRLSGMRYHMLAIRQATLEAAAKVRAGEPFVLEIATSRYKEHVGVGEDFHFNYRTSDGVDAWKRRDPLIVDGKLAAALRPEIDREIEAAVAFAEASPVALNC